MAKIIPAEHIDNWYWCAVYDDGSQLEELEDDGTLHGYQDIDQERLVAFILRPLHEHLPQFAVQLHPGERLIFFRKRRLIAQLAPGGDPINQGRLPSHQAIGVAANGVEVVTFIDESGNAVLTTDRDAI